MKPVEIKKGDGPIILAMPHCGLNLPGEVRDALNETGDALADADWNIDKLYEGLLENATIVRATFHRYVIDANRDPSGANPYPGQKTTALCPLTDFGGRPLYKKGRAPGVGEIERRRVAWHAPYHAALDAELKRVRAAHGVAILYDCHSIRSRIPYLFDGVLPDFNIGTNDGASCAPQLEKVVEDICRDADGFTSVVNGRFKGGWTTRRYGRPERGVHAIQMELAQSVYMQESPPWTYSPERADRIRPHLQTILHTLDELARAGALTDGRRRHE